MQKIILSSLCGCFHPQNTWVSKFIFFFLFNSLIISALFAQEKKALLKGVVLEMNEKGKFTPLVGATAQWLGTSQGTVTDTSGVFQIRRHETANKLIISFVGMKNDTISVDKNSEIKVILAEAGELKEVEVTGERASTYIDHMNPLKTQVMTEKELFKAACCNLSESFETNPSVDVSFSDAVTGAKQIQMLGLSGTYTQITTENLPSVRGLAANYGLTFIPGTWVESIQVSKGVGSVANGFESMTGQINVELKKPHSEKMFFNAYANDMGRIEANLNLSKPIGTKWGTTLLLHANQLANFQNRLDMNHDGFYDQPYGSQFNVANRWHFSQINNWEGQFGVKFLADNRIGGQYKVHEEHTYHQNNPYIIDIKTNRAEAFAKIGYVFPQKKHQSFGSMFSFVNHNQNSVFGERIYKANSQTFYTNLLYQSIINNTNHKFRTGLSLVYDKYDEQYNYLIFKRKEIVAGGFFEYTWAVSPRINVVAGLRADYHNLFGFFLTPRFHAKFDVSRNSALRISAGRGQRTANIFAENSAVFVSSRRLEIDNQGNTGKAYGLNPEIAWNLGINYTVDFEFFGKDASWSTEYYRTDFENQILTDLDRSPQAVWFANLNGKSYSNSFQTELNFTLFKHLEVRTAYRFLDVKGTYNGQLLERPFTAKHRIFANFAYKTPNNWIFDYTVSWLGSKRIPNTTSNPVEYQKAQYSPNYWVMNAQISKSFSKRFDAYIGMENMLDTRQQDLLIAADYPLSPYFDASMIWGMVQTRMTYVGIRWKIE